MEAAYYFLDSSLVLPSIALDLALTLALHGYLALPRLKSHTYTVVRVHLYEVRAQINYTPCLLMQIAPM